MKNTLAQSNMRTFVAPYAVASGAAFKVGSYVAVAATTAASGASVEGAIRGGFSGLAKATGEAWAVGDLLYWNDTNKNFAKTASGAVKAGIAYAAALSGDTTGSVDLVPTI